MIKVNLTSDDTQQHDGPPDMIHREGHSIILCYSCQKWKNIKQIQTEGQATVIKLYYTLQKSRSQGKTQELLEKAG